VNAQVDTERKDFIMSEKKAQQGVAMRNIKLGSVVRAVVTRVEDYGVFVDLVDLPGVSGLVRAAPDMYRVLDVVLLPKLHVLL
jgi:ribosomal protein S1